MRGYGLVVCRINGADGEISLVAVVVVVVAVMSHVDFVLDTSL